MKKAPLLQIIAEASTNGDIETLFINTVEAGARLMLEAADAVRGAGSMPDKERINAVFSSMARVTVYCSNVTRAVEGHLATIKHAVDMVEANGLIDELDEAELYNRDRELLTLRPTMFNFDEEETDGRE